MRIILNRTTMFEKQIQNINKVITSAYNPLKILRMIKRLNPLVLRKNSEECLDKYKISYGKVV